MAKSGSKSPHPKAKSTGPGPEHRPGYIVVFRQRSERNISTVSRVLGVGEADGRSTRAGCVELMSNHAGATRPRVYQRLGVAVADLSQEERASLARDDRVEAVVPNEVRELPPYYESQAQEAGEGPSTAPDTGAAWALSAVGDPAALYAAGMRDASEAILRAIGRFQAAGPHTRVAQGGGGEEHSWCLSMIGLQSGYAALMGKGARIAVLDTGIDLQHPDFQGRFQGGNDAQSFVNGETVQDGNGHGTHCAGVIAASAASVGGRRYAVAPGADLVIGKVLGDDGRGYDDQILDGIDWAADVGAMVISMSLGSRRRTNQPYSDPYEAVAANLLEGTPGVLMLAACGNESSRPAFTSPVGNPAACPSILAVAAVDPQRRIADFSNRQTDAIGEVNFSAPGVGVYSAWADGGFRTISGTSMATPHVAGVAALVIEERPLRRATEVAERLRALCVPLGDPADFGVGLVQVP
ncbi:MAG: S8 family serine peptidase [Phycisphaerales bacterium]|nr:S8 family serine peptidase [Phycisphaerales bacterium]